MKGLLLAALLLFGSSVSGPAADVTPADFAFGMAVLTDREAPIYEVSLPAEVYESVLRPDLGDLRVFNRDGEVVPHNLQTDRPASTQPAPISLPLFPLPAEPAGPAGALSLRVQTDKDGAILNVETGPPGETPTGPTAYILDASQLPHRPDRLELFWRQEGNGLVTEVEAFASSDLDHWTPASEKRTVADVQYGGRRLVARTLDIRFSGKYLRLTWPAGSKGAPLTGVTAHFPPLFVEPERQWKKLEAAAVSEKPGQYVFDAKGYFPADRLRFEPPQRNTLAGVALWSRNSETERWIERYAGIVYNLEFEGGTLRNDEISMSPLMDRHFLIDVDQSGGGLGAGLPELHVGWRPQRLFFVARGQGPFTLAFGNAETGPIGTSLDPLLADDVRLRRPGLVAPAALAAGTELGGTERLEPPAPSESPRSVKQYIIWAILISAVLILALMAWRLARQMDSDEDASGE